MNLKKRKKKKNKTKKEEKKWGNERKVQGITKNESKWGKESAPRQSPPARNLTTNPYSGLFICVPGSSVTNSFNVNLEFPGTVWTSQHET